MKQLTPVKPDLFHLTANTLLSLVFMGLVALLIIDSFSSSAVATVAIQSQDTKKTEHVGMLSLITSVESMHLLDLGKSLKTSFSLKNITQTASSIFVSLNDMKEQAHLKQTIKTHYNLHESRAENFSRWIYEAHQQTQVPIGFITALIASESSFRYSVVSTVGAVGPAQVRPSHWQAFCGVDLLEPRQNVLCGAKALRQLYGSPACQEDWSCAFAHYNVGRGNLLSNRFPGAAERYVSRIKSKLDMAPSLWPKGLSLEP